MQVSRELTWLYAEAGARMATCVGGMDPRREQRALAAGCHIVVGTPGRLRDHLERGNLDLSALKVVVLDEADEMLDLGFREDLEVILDATPAERRTLLFSATIAKEIATLARRYQSDALRIDTTAPRRAARRHRVPRHPRRAQRDRARRRQRAALFREPRRAGLLRHPRGACGTCTPPCASAASPPSRLSGELSQNERTDALQALRDGHARVCVATDVAARGLDLPDLGLVIHADLPVNKAGLLHRSRPHRPGRAKGISVLLVPYTRRRKAELLLASASIDADWAGPPTADEIRAKDQERLLDDPILTEPPSRGRPGAGRAAAGRPHAGGRSPRP